MLKVGIIGCGGIAERKHMPALATIKDVSMTAFCDISAERAGKMAEKFGAAGASGAAAYVDYREMLDAERLDVVHICSANSTHSEIAVAAMESGCHVMCEKPMARNYAEAKAMLDAHKRTGKKLTIGCQNRFRPDSLYLKKACDRGDLGEIYFAKAHAVRRRGVPTWGVFLNRELQGGGPLIDIGIHSLDLTLWLMNNYKVKSVTGSVFSKLKDQTETGNIFGDWNPEKFTVEDSAFGFIKMENGATVILECSWAINLLDEIEAKTTLAGTKAGADMNDGLRINSCDFGKLNILKPKLDVGRVPFYEGETQDPGILEAQSWINCVLNDTDPVVLPEQALVVSRILDAVYESSETGKTVEF